MAVAIGATKACLQVQQVLDDIAGGNVPTLKIENFGGLQWVTSSTNTAGFEGLQNQDPGGQNRTVKIWYWTNPRTAAGTDCTPDICTPGTTNAQKYAEMTLNLCRDVKLTLNEQQFRDFCDGAAVKNSGFAQQQVKAVLNQLLSAIDLDLITYINAHAGNFYGPTGSTAGPKTLILMRPDGSPYYGGGAEIASDMEDAGYPAAIPALIGLGYLRQYAQAAKLACCDSTGIDLSKGSPLAYYTERRVDTVVGTGNDFFALAPGAVQLVTKVKWVGAFEDVRNENEAKTTVMVTVPGGGTIPVDFTVYRNFCGTNNDGLTNWVMTWSVNFDFFSLPSDVEAVGSNWRSVNGIFHYKATCGTPTCADVNS